VDGSIRAVPDRIFISYRREDAAYPAGWLFDRLADRFGKDHVFKDVDSIQLGDDFVEVITSAVESCNVLLAVIGKQWLTITDEHGSRRLNNPNDFVRLEIEAALARNIRVIPILVEEAQMPRPDQLPASLAKLARRNALEVSPNRFASDTGRLLAVLERTLADGHARYDRAGEAAQASEPPVANAETAQTQRASSAAEQIWSQQSTKRIGSVSALRPAAQDVNRDSVSASRQVGRTADPAATPALPTSKDGHVLWALIPVLTLGVLLPVPIAYAAKRLRSLMLWLATLAYTILWGTLLIVIIVQSNLGHLDADLTASGWLLFFAVVAAVHALRLRHRVFAAPNVSLLRSGPSYIA
jgi:hypothetical protein